MQSQMRFNMAKLWSSEFKNNIVTAASRQVIVFPANETIPEEIYPKLKKMHGRRDLNG